MALLRSLPQNATLADLRRTYADLLEKLRLSLSETYVLKY